MFDQQMIETETAEVNILDVDSDTLKLLLEFIYTGKVSSLIHFIALKTFSLTTGGRGKLHSRASLCCRQV